MPKPSRDVLALGALVTLGAALRVALARGDLWLDELWSLSFARQITWPWEVLTALHHDNNHPLNTLALFLTVKLAGAHAAPVVYRLLPLAAGIAAIPLLFRTESATHDPSARSRAWFAARTAPRRGATSAYRRRVCRCARTATHRRARP